MLAPAYAQDLPSDDTQQTYTVPFPPNESDLSEAEKAKLLNALEGDLTPTIWADIYAYATAENNNESDIRRLALKRAIALSAYLQESGVPERHINLMPRGRNDDTQSPSDRADILLYHRP